MHPFRILLIDDHKLVRQGLRAVLEPDARFEIVGDVSSGNEALDLIKIKPLDIVLMDLKLPDIDGINLIGRILQINSKIAILVLTAFIDASLVNGCLQAGAKGYLVKDAENLNLKEQLMAVGQGYAAYDPRAASMVTQFALHHSSQTDLLKQREIEIVRLVAQGLSNREISENLNLSEYTIKGYLKEIFSKLEVNNRIEAVMRAKDRGIL